MHIQWERGHKTPATVEQASRSSKSKAYFSFDAVLTSPKDNDNCKEKEQNQIDVSFAWFHYKLF